MIEWLCHKRHDTYDSLAQRFHVSRKTIQNDILVLTSIYPIETVRGRYGGGVKIADWYHPHRILLTPDEADLLIQLEQTLCGNDSKLMKGIIAKFALPRNTEQL